MKIPREKSRVFGMIVLFLGSQIALGISGGQPDVRTRLLGPFTKTDNVTTIEGPNFGNAIIGKTKGTEEKLGKKSNPPSQNLKEDTSNGFKSIPDPEKAVVKDSGEQAKSNETAIPATQNETGKTTSGVSAGKKASPKVAMAKGNIGNADAGEGKAGYFAPKNGRRIPATARLRDAAGDVKTDYDPKYKFEGPRRPPVPKRFRIDLCFFFDPKYDSNYGRKTIKTVVDAMAKCDIAVVPHETTLRENTFDRDDPENINANAKAHCNVKAFYQDPTIKSAAQTHPDSKEASDRMCVEGWKKLPESPKKYEVGGCAVTPGDVSIVDINGGGGVATHEFGHNLGTPGRGGGVLENEGEKGVLRTKGGFNLQGRDTDEIGRSNAHPEGSEDFTGAAFTDYGCKSLRGEAKDQANIPEEKRALYFPDAFEEYYTRITDPENQLDFNGRFELFRGPPIQVATAKKTPPPLHRIQTQRPPPIPEIASAAETQRVPRGEPPVSTLPLGHRIQPEGALNIASGMATPTGANPTAPKKEGSRRNNADIYQQVSGQQGNPKEGSRIEYQKNGITAQLTRQEELALLRGESISPKKTGETQSTSETTTNSSTARSDNSADTRSSESASGRSRDQKLQKEGTDGRSLATASGQANKDSETDDQSELDSKFFRKNARKNRGRANPADQMALGERRRQAPIY